MAEGLIWTRNFKMSISIVGLGLLMAGYQTTAIATLRCVGGGGGGGVPFSQIAGSETLDWLPLSASGNIQELVMVESERTLLYRNQNGEVWEKNLKTGGHFPRIWNAFLALSRVIDPEGRFISNEGNTDQLWTFDRRRNHLSTINFSEPAQKAELLFWNDSAAYLATGCHYGDEYNRTMIVRANRINETSENICELSTPVQWGEIKFARGAIYPFAFFYAIHQRNAANPVAGLYEANVKSCKIRPVAENGPEIPSPITDFVYFSETSAFGLFLANKNLIWWNAVGCKYLNTEAFELFSPNPAFPLLVGWKPGAPIRLFDPIQETERALGLGLTVAELSHKRSWLSGTDLYIAPQITGEHWRSLIMVDLSVD